MRKRAAMIMGVTAYVYLPYGYDEKDGDTRYDILYLMHGWGMTANLLWQKLISVQKNLRGE